MDKDKNMTKKTDKKILDLKEVGYQNLSGKTIKLKFDNEDFGNALYDRANTIEMDEVARSFHKHGKAEISDKIKKEFVGIISQLYSRRAVEAIKKIINN